MAPIPRLRAYEGPALLSYGFRPFFLLGSLYAGLAILTWLPMFYGELALSSAFAPRDWHVHEMLYGYLSAVVTGFLLTAVPNWTGRMPLQGRPLLALVLIWAAGRVAVTTSAWIGWQAAALVDVSFLMAVAAAIAREIVKGRNWRNLKVLTALGILTAGNIVFHLEAHFQGSAEYGIRIGIAATMMLVMVIGGRIVPSFTRNWLARENPGRLPAPFGTFDMVSTAAAGAALLAWIALPEWRVTGVALVAAGLVQAVHLARWAGDRTWRDRLVLILHVAYAFVPLGFVLTGLAALGVIPAGAGIHAWTGGAMGGMTLAVMSRASLGHTGRALVATRTTQALYALIVVAALARILAVLMPHWTTALIHLAGAAWAATFIGFALTYWNVLARPRVKA
ncbi:NnrS family protein [Microvirga arsenatis]|uniref:Short-chain dehydrogenase n=1 Tax=Microvirga arsenatis TaxID=2692265 RepID=A0ABW9YYD0_9HYPH|nr:NnrS family protein [Microvirga arsenatis]NBJ11108.1 short-chain dehydrogenase [Microvirga arsenatis]NBJ25381.1 short-chain dehydrogenase [Microvirga arsenatis]